MLVHTFRHMLAPGAFTAMPDTFLPLRTIVVTHGGVAYSCDTLCHNDNDDVDDDDEYDGDVSVLVPVNGLRQLEGLETKWILECASSTRTIIVLAEAVSLVKQDDDAVSSVEVFLFEGLDEAAGSMHIHKHAFRADEMAADSVHACALNDSHIIVYDAQGKAATLQDGVWQCVPLFDATVIDIVPLPGADACALAITRRGMLAYLQYDDLSSASLLTSVALTEGHEVSAISVQFKPGLDRRVLVCALVTVHTLTRQCFVSIHEFDMALGVSALLEEWQIINDGGMRVYDTARVWLVHTKANEFMIMIACEHDTCWLQYAFSCE